MRIRKHYEGEQLQSLDQTPQQNPSPDNSSATGFSNIQKGVLSLGPFVLIGIGIGIVLIIILIICLIYNKIKNRNLYEDSPENFSSKPDLGFFATRAWKNNSIKTLTEENEHEIVKKADYEGQFYEVTFKTHQNCVYFEKSQTEDCYFQVQFLQLSSILQIGFVHKEDLKNLTGGDSNKKKKNINLDQFGISIKTDGTVMVYGVNTNTFDFRIQYGDTLGIGLTKHDSARRAWFTKNGVILNPATQEEMMKEIKITEKDTDQNQAVMKKKAVMEQQDEEEKEKQEKLAAKRKVQVKTSKKFKYYAVVISASPDQSGEATRINWNMGAHTFRLYDAGNFNGLLH